MVQDHYGMVGLLTFIRGAETDPNLVALALGRYIYMQVEHLYFSSLSSSFFPPSFL